MSGHLPTAVSIVDGEIIIAAELLAPKLGLSVEALKKNMRKGLVTSIAETGVVEDAGRTRLIFRYGPRIWRIVVEADGTLNEDPVPDVVTATPPNSIETASGVFAPLVRAHLRRVAERGMPITYQALAKALDLTPPNTIHQVTEALEDLMREDAANGDPFIAALVISKARSGLPAIGFFDCASRLGRFTGDANGSEARSFYEGQLSEALKFWGARETVVAKRGRDELRRVKRGSRDETVAPG